jgi:predicted AAA+ superfamily ATPase
MLIRAIHPRITERLFKGKAVIFHGARQVGKTTLIKTMQTSFGDNDALYLNCDEPDNRALLTDVTSKQLQSLKSSHISSKMYQFRCRKFP